MTPEPCGHLLGRGPEDVGGGAVEQFGGAPGGFPARVQAAWPSRCAASEQPARRTVSSTPAPAWRSGYWNCSQSPGSAAVSVAVSMPYSTPEKPIWAVT